MLPYTKDDPKTLVLKKNPEQWKNLAISLCERHEIKSTEFTPYYAGSSLVAAMSEEVVIKIIQPAYISEWEAEKWALERLPSDLEKISIKIPKHIAAVKDESGWSYILMSRIPGKQLDQIWPDLKLENRVSLMFEIGKLMSYVHENSKLEKDKYQIKWKDFIGTQKEKCQARHKRLGMPEWFVNEIPSFLNKLEFCGEKVLEPKLLTGEYTPFNLLGDCIDGTWKLTGMIDFADAFAGDPLYDLIGPVVFMGEGNPSLVCAVVEGYGVGENKLDRNLKNRLMGLHLLHAFSNFNTQVKNIDWRNKAKSLCELTDLIWAFER